VKHTEQRGIWVPTQHLLWDQGLTEPCGSSVIHRDGHESARSTCARIYARCLRAHISPLPARAYPPTACASLLVHASNVMRGS
jgi:hypothetical protein